MPCKKLAVDLGIISLIVQLLLVRYITETKIRIEQN